MHICISCCGLKLTCAKHNNQCFSALHLNCLSHFTNRDKLRTLDLRYLSCISGHIIQNSFETKAIERTAILNNAYNNKCCYSMAVVLREGNESVHLNRLK